MKRPTDVPVYREDIYTREAILDPYPHYARLRALGPVVWLDAHRCYAVPRYDECKSVLLDDQTFISGEGVGLGCVANRMSRGTTLNSDGDEHARRRQLLAHRLTPRALRAMRADIEAAADSLAAHAIEHRRVEGVGDLATALPMTIVPDLVGWPEEGRENLLSWAGATFDLLGPTNRQAVSQAANAVGMLRFARRVVRERSQLEGSMGDDVMRAADAWEIPMSGCPALLIDYLAPSLDTTISAIASALLLFAQHPEQWDLVRADPSLIPNAVNEVVRFESPLRAFSRKVAGRASVAGTSLREGSRVVVLYSSANRDELAWERADRFDITRDAGRQLGFGHGVHGCAGQGLARLETQSLLAALAPRVKRIELVGDPVWGVNNIIRRLERLPLELVPA